MRKTILPVLATATLALGGCASTGYGGGGYGGGGLGGLLGGILGGTSGGYDTRNLNEFERAGVNACGREASRYGSVNIETAGQVDRDEVRVVGYVRSSNRGSGRFDCTFRNDGQITNFRIG